MIATFDTLKFAQRLEQGGVPTEQARVFAEAQKEAFAEAIETKVATKGDILSLQSQIDLLKWMIGFNLAFTMAILWKVFA